MHILITGAAGMIGRKLTERLIVDRALGDQPIEKLTLVDIVAPNRPAGFSDHVKTRAADLADPGVAEKAISERPEVIFHLAGVVSGEAELNFEKGYRTNLDGMRALLEAIRKTGDGYKPRLIFTSSMAVYGAPFHQTISDEFHLTPLTSYGTQKLMCEAMLTDYTRKGFIEGVGIRLPSIVVRPGKPNKAASGFFSGIIREPLAGMEAQLPVSDSVVHTHASPRSAVGFLIHGAELPRDKIEPHVNITMPGVCCTVGEQIEALKRVAGDKVAARVRRVPDELVMRIVAGWPHRLEGTRATALGFTVEKTFDEIIKVHIDEDLGGKVRQLAMRFAAPLIPATLVKRYKRFLADVTLPDGTTITAHVANPGGMTGLAAPGARVWLSKSDNPKRKLSHSWELVEVDYGGGVELVGVNTGHPNPLVGAALAVGAIPELAGYETIRREVKYGRNSRVDFLLESAKRPACYVEIKNVHLMRQRGLAEFPDFKTERGAKHLEELGDMVEQGHRAVMLFLIQIGSAKRFALARDIDPKYGAAYDRARSRGVEAMAWKCRIEQGGIEIVQPVEVVE